VTYRCGIDTRTATVLGLEPDRPRIICDQCGIKHGVENVRGLLAGWFMNNRAPPGWTLRIWSDGKRQDFCGRCLPKPKRSKLNARQKK
jgi:hypothetical protein